MSKSLTVSVGMTTYNSAKFVREQLESILNQTILPDEIVIFDDASTDNTVEMLNNILGGLENISVKIFSNEKNIGYIKNFEQCFNSCSGDIIVSCDADDIWFPDKVKKIKECFSNEQVVYVYHDAIVIDGDGNVINESLNSTWDHLEDKENAEQILLRNVRRQGFPYGMTMAFKRNLLEEITPFMFAHDGWINMCAPLFGRIVCITEPLSYYRRHGHNTSGSNGESVFKRARQTEKQPWFDWPSAYVNSYSTYYDRFSERLPIVVKTELEEQIRFRKMLVGVVEEKSKIRAIMLLLKDYKILYKKYRGTWKTLLIDIYNLFVH